MVARRPVGTPAARYVQAAFAAIVIATHVACGRTAGPLPKDGTPHAQMRRTVSSDEAAKRAAEARSPARSHLLGTIARKAIGPFAARARDGGIAAWIVAAERGAGAELVVVPFGIDGAPLRDPRVVASVPRETTSLVVRPTERNRGGWLVVWSALLDRGESIALLELAQDGTVRGAPAELQRTSDHVTWVDLVPTPHGALSIWAEDTVASGANILVCAIGSDGKPVGMPARVARGVARWAIVRAGDGVGLAIVTRAKDAAAGTLSWVQLDGEGHPRGLPTAIGKEPTVSGDVELASFANRSLILWTDRTGEDAQVSLASVDANGSVLGPVRAMNAVGGASLLSVASGEAGISLLWEEAHSRPRTTRTIHLATVSTAGGLAAQPVTSLDVLTQAPLELVSTDDGFALLATPARDCGAADGSCTAVPVVVRYDAHLAPIQAEPLVVGPMRAPAVLAWGLRCSGDRCVALAATDATPTPVFAIDLPRRTSPFATPTASHPPPPGAPQVTGIVTLASEQPYADLAAARVGDATLVATLTARTDESSKRAHRGQTAKIAVRPFDDNGRALDVPSTLTTRAAPLGRVAIAASSTTPVEAVAAWLAGDANEAEVHMARIDARGHRTKEAQLTSTKGEAGSVAITWADDGWLVAWVDARDGNGEVYAAKIDRNLTRVAPDRRIRHAPGDAADVSLAASGDTAWVAWSDPRESPRDGIGDIYVVTVSARDAKRTGEESRVLATAAHSRSPELVAVGNEALLGWIEDAPTGLETAGAAMLAHVDGSGHVVGVPQALQLAGPGRPTAIVLGAYAAGVQGVIARSGSDGVLLDAFAFSTSTTGAQQGPPWTVVDLEAQPSFDTALALAGGALFYNDTGAVAGDHRVRRAAIAW
jgi:hypothetical protein